MQPWIWERCAFILILSHGLFSSIINNMMLKVTEAWTHRVAGVSIQMQSAVKKRRRCSAALITGGSGWTCENITRANPCRIITPNSQQIREKERRWETHEKSDISPFTFEKQISDKLMEIYLPVEFLLFSHPVVLFTCALLAPSSQISNLILSLTDFYFSPYHNFEIEMQAKQTPI